LWLAPKNGPVSKLLRESLDYVGFKIAGDGHLSLHPLFSDVKEKILTSIICIGIMTGVLLYAGMILKVKFIYL